MRRRPSPLSVELPPSSFALLPSPIFEHAHSGPTIPTDDLIKDALQLKNTPRALPSPSWILAPSYDSALPVHSTGNNDSTADHNASTSPNESTHPHQPVLQTNPTNNTPVIPTAQSAFNNPPLPPPQQHFATQNPAPLNDYNLFPKSETFSTNKQKQQHVARPTNTQSNQVNPMLSHNPDSFIPSFTHGQRIQTSPITPSLRDLDIPPSSSHYSTPENSVSLPYAVPSFDHPEAIHLPNPTKRESAKSRERRIALRKRRRGEHGPSLESTQEFTPPDKKTMRAIRNREAALKSRKEAKKKLLTLEQENQNEAALVKQLDQQNIGLKAELASLVSRLVPQTQLPECRVPDSPRSRRNFLAQLLGAPTTTVMSN